VFGSVLNQLEQQSMMPSLLRYRPARVEPDTGGVSRPDTSYLPCRTRARRRRAVLREAAHFPTKGFIMKHALILLAFSSTLALTACQREAPPVVQVIAGPAGAPGATGATGAAGAQARPGATGETGAKGQTGTTGQTGESGMAGATGAPGYDGAKGEVGATGATGDDGAKGDKGRTGDTVVVLPQR
jgi:hypothetical protein